MDKLEVDELGFVWIDRLKVCRLTMQSSLEFYDRDKRRSQRRGSSFVYISIAQLRKLLDDYEEMLK